MTPIIIAQRAKILTLKSEGKTTNEIAKELDVNPRTVLLWCNKYKDRKEKDTLDDLLNVSKGRGCKEEITGEQAASLHDHLHRCNPCIDCD